MYDVYVTYVDKQDKELLDLVNFNTPIYLHIFNMSTTEGRKQGFKIKNECSAKLDPFVSIKEDGKLIKAFYSEESNAIQQLINWLNAS